MNSIARTSALVDSTHNLTVEAAGSARLVNSRPVAQDASSTQIKKLLDSRNDREVLDGLRKVIHILYRSKPSLPYFSAVIKNVASPNVEIKKLVYVFLLHHAESEPDLALLSINTIQKSLSDQSPQVRAMALRVMSGIRVPVISQIVSLAIKKAMMDMSPFVRKAAALAIPKCYDLDPNTQPQLLDYIAVLLGDRQYFVVGPAVTAFLHVCPERLDLIHKHYRALIRKVVDMDEWSQIATMRLLIIYGRKCFPRRTRRVVSKQQEGFYEDEGDKQQQQSSDRAQDVLDIDPDLSLFLNACKSLLASRNSAVILSAVRCLLYLGTPSDSDACIGPLVALLRASKDIQLVAMYNIVLVCLKKPASFARHAQHFLVSYADTLEICRLKFEVLSLIYSLCDEHISELILSEFEYFSHSSDRLLIQESVRAIGRCAQTNDDASRRCLNLLLSQITTQDGQVVAEALTVIRMLIQKDTARHITTVIKLAKNLDRMTNPSARATVIWLVGEYAGLPDDQNVAPDVLRILTSKFAEESEAAKLQIVLLAAKVYLHHLLRKTTSADGRTESNLGESDQSIRDRQARIDSDQGANEQPMAIHDHEEEPESTIKLLWDHILQLVRYDTSYDLRDRARMFQALLADPSSTQLASLVLLAPKPVPQAQSPSENRQGLLLGSNSLIVGSKALVGFEDLPDWVKDGKEPDPNLRQEALAAGHPSPKVSSVAADLDRAVEAQGLAGVSVPGKEKSLDDWLNEEQNEEETEESEATEEESSSEYEEVTASESEEESEGENVPLVQ